MIDIFNGELAKTGRSNYCDFNSINQLLKNLDIISHTYNTVLHNIELPLNIEHYLDCKHHVDSFLFGCKGYEPHWISNDGFFIYQLSNNLQSLVNNILDPEITEGGHLC